MRILALLLLLASCNGNDRITNLEKENEVLQRKVDSLKNELHKCDMLLKSYEGMPMGI